MTKLIVNADDFGYSKGVNLGIVEAFQNGIVTSATLMANMPGAAHAAALAKENPNLGVGIHLVLTCGKPVSKAVPSLIDANGRFRSLREIERLARPDEIEREFRSQIEKFLSFGLRPTHIDSHHHAHGLENVLPIVANLAKEYSLPVRLVPGNAEQLKNMGVKTVAFFDDRFYGEQLTAEYLINMLEQASFYETAEIMCHPAFIDEALLSGSSYALLRAKELSILTSGEIRKAVEARNIQLISYKGM
ncbi:MAG: chitin disaccharide deacetylase [Ectobacillus sp.]